MVGQLIIMIVMLTLGLEIFLRGVVPGFLGASPKQLNLGISFAPVIIGDVFINRTYLLGGVVAIALIILSTFFFRSRPGTSFLAVYDDHESMMSVGVSVVRDYGCYRRFNLLSACA